MTETLVPSVPAPAINLPAGSKFVTVKVINTTLYLKLATSMLVSPTIKGHESTECPAYAFLIEHESEGKTRRLLFDLGLRKDWQNLSPAMSSHIANDGEGIHTELNVADILTEGGTSLSDVEAIVWSHWHIDHIGDPSTFPPTTDLIVGPGFKENLLPGYPANPDSAIQESDYSGRNLREIDFVKEGDRLMLGGFPAFDYFGDGSFYLLDAPGHTIGHMCGLARTSVSPPTFILMGADSCHHGAEMRPSKYLPLPKSIIPNPINPRRAGRWPRRHGAGCPGSLFQAIHPKGSAAEPFYEPSPSGLHHDLTKTAAVISQVQEFDALENVFVCIAHDTTLLDVIDFYPDTANQWKEKNWKETSKWMFLRDLTGAVECLHDGHHGL